MEVSASYRQNNFDFLRFLAAFIVIYGHCQALSGHKVTALVGSNLASLGIYIFLAISGYLVTESWLRQPSLLPFLAKRSLRIFPGLAVAVLAAAFILGPLMTRLPLADYLQHPFIARYLKNIALYVGFSLPGVFETNPHKHVVNGSLWSLPVEFFCYLLIATFAFIPSKFRVFYLIGCLAVAIIADRIRYWYGLPPVVLYATNVFFVAKYSAFFVVGALIRLWSVPLNSKVAATVLIGLLAGGPYIEEETAVIVLWFCLPYVVLSIGVASTPVLRDWAKYGDVSYGMYLYSFPLTQTAIAITGNALNLYELTTAVTFASVACGFMSWHLVEKRALRLKPFSRPSSPIPAIT